LGVDIDDRLDFSLQTQRIVTSTKRGIGALCSSLRKWAPREVFYKAIDAIVLPAFLYAIEAWYPPHQKDQKKLEQVIRYAGRLILNDFEIKYDDLLGKLNWKPLFRRIAEKRLLLVKKYMEGCRFIPSFVFEFEGEEQSRHSQRLKSKQQKHCLALKIFRNQKNVHEEKLSAAQMRILWNALDEETVLAKLRAFQLKIGSDDIFGRLCSSGVVNQIDYE
jgi:hypothetical protein